MNPALNIAVAQPSGFPTKTQLDDSTPDGQIWHSGRSCFGLLQLTATGWPVHMRPRHRKEIGGNAGEPPIPQNVQDTLDQIDAGKWPGSANAPGTKGGGVFDNDQQLLPTRDASGQPITYQEWDVNPRAPGQTRDSDRIVTGSDGSAWYTTDHYQTFHRIR